MYKRLLLVIPVILLTIWLASSFERSYTEPEIISGALSSAPSVHTELPVEPISSDSVDTDAITAPLIPSQTTQPMPDTAESDVSDVPEKPIDPPSTTTPTESTTIPEIPIITEPPIVPVTSAIAETTSTPENTVSPETTAEPPPTDTQTVTVYWVPNGEVWHTKINCSTLSRSKNILSGTIEAAMLAGKERVCKRCG